jgi:asparagine synthase (glutamine-hydrolysing)
MADASGRYTIIYNGEVYNYVELREELKAAGAIFKTASDTEVVLQSYIVWGEKGLSKLRGMFAFAIHDKVNDSLFLARDRYGKKPLFIYENNDGLFFASEIKGILTVPGIARNLDFNSVQDYMLLRYVPSPNTFFKGISKLPAGSFAHYTNGKLHTTSYYRLADAWIKPATVQPKDPRATFANALEEAVRVRMVADVPFGVFLSGGLDSSVVAALMGRHMSSPVRSFSIGFDDPRYSEAPYAERVSKHLGTEHQVVKVSADEVLDALPRAIELSDAPVAEPGSIMVYLLSRAARPSVKMVLTGEGADEMLGGYPKHYFERFASTYQVLVPEFLHNAVVRPLASILPFNARRIKTLVETLGLRNDHERLIRWFGALTYDQRDKLFSRQEALRDLDQTPFATEPGQSALRRALYFDQSMMLPDNLLERGDRMTMGGSIEARMPFMDHILAETVAGLPDSMRISGTHQKYCLRKLAETILPKEIAWRQKLGFSTPMRSWMQTRLAGPLQDLLLDQQSISASFLDRRKVEKALSDHRNGRVDNEKLLWMLMNLEMFLRQYKPSLA